MFSLAQFIEHLENQGATRGEVEGGKAPRALVKGVWKVSDALLSHEAIEAALATEVSATHKGELPKKEGRFWFRVERPLGAWMVCVEWKSSAVLPRRTLTFVSQNSVAYDPLEAAETAGFSSAGNMQELKSSAPQGFSPSAKSGAAPRNLEQLPNLARPLPSSPPPLVPAIAPPPLPPGFVAPPTRAQSPDAGKLWEPPRMDEQRSPPSALENSLDAISPGAWRAGFSLVGVGVVLLSLAGVRGCNAQGSYSPMLAKAIRQDANASQKWQSKGIILDEVQLHKVDEDSYEGTGIYSDGSGATVEVEVESWTWINTPSTWSYKVTPQTE